MDFTCAVWYEDTLAHYYVSQRNNKRYEAHLLHLITPLSEQQPPRKVVLTLRHRHWHCDHGHEELVKNLSGAIEANLFVLNEV